MSGIRTYRFGSGLVIDRGAAAPLLLLDAAGRAIWQALDAGCSQAEIRTVMAKGHALVTEIMAARLPAPCTTIAPAPAPERPLRRRVRTYALSGANVAVDSADGELDALVHPRLAHTETCAPAVATVRLRRTRCGFALLENGRPAEHHERVEALIGAVMRRLVEIGHDEPAWCAVLHAASVADGAGGAIVLPGACGRGKSTLTAALLAAGADYLSDDCVPLDPGGLAVPVPFGICFKQSGWDAGEAVLPESASALVFHCDERGPCRYVPPRRVATGRLPLSALVFPSYEPGAPLSMTSMRPEETLAALVAGRAWLSREPDGLEMALATIERTPGWRLSYGTTADALAAVTSLGAANRAA